MHVIPLSEVHKRRGGATFLHITDRPWKTHLTKDDARHTVHAVEDNKKNKKRDEHIVGFLICVLIKQDSECYLPSVYSVGRTELAVSPPCFIVRQTSTCVLKTRTHDYNQIFSSLSWMQSKQELINSSFETEGTLNTHTGYVSLSTRVGFPREFPQQQGSQSPRDQYSP